MHPAFSSFGLPVHLIASPHFGSFAGLQKLFISNVVHIQLRQKDFMA
jgi:hypothetical protein